MHAITGITGKVGRATTEFHHRGINMRNLTVALVTLAVIAGAGVARADSSGHMDINGLDEELPRSYDPLAPMGDALVPPNSSPCAFDQSGAMPHCPSYYWRRR